MSLRYVVLKGGAYKPLVAVAPGQHSSSPVINRWN
jgi:hypothetical protein